MYPDIYEKMLKITELKEHDARLFKIYSSKEQNEVQLVFNGFIRNGFVVSQKLGDKSYKSYCTQKDKAEFKYSKMLELLKKISF